MLPIFGAFGANFVALLNTPPLTYFLTIPLVQKLELLGFVNVQLYSKMEHVEPRWTDARTEVNL